MTDSADAVAARFLAAADSLTRDPEANALLRFLGYEASDPAEAEGRARLLRAAAKLRRFFQLPVPDAPGLVFFGGEADPGGPGLPVGSLSGSGFTPGRAFESCVGEGIEYLSQFAQKDDAIEIGTMRERCGNKTIADILAASDVDPDRPIGWIRMRQLPGESDAWFPADLCLRRSAETRDFTPPVKLSTGCAAGMTKDDATLRAILELVERDASALWWRGGRRGRAITPDSEAGLAAAALLPRLRQDNQDRRCWLLDITTDLDIPVIAAVSAREDGFGFAFGLAARMHPAEAARAAIFEMCQVELAHHVVAAKQRESGETLLNENDRLTIARGTLIDTRDCPLLQPDGESRLTPPDDDILTRLAAIGIETFQLDLTRAEFQVPVIRVMAPGLQADPGAIIGERLARAISETGGGEIHTSGLLLL